MRSTWILLLVIIFLSVSNTVTVSTKKDNPLSEEDEAVDRAVILYVSDHLTPAECFKLVNFLADASTTSHLFKETMKNIGGKSPTSFECHPALKWWNQNFLKHSSDEILKNNIAEDLLALGLKYANGELETWWKETQRKRTHNEIVKQWKEWNRHKKADEFARNQSTNLSITNKGLPTKESKVQSKKLNQQNQKKGGHRVGSNSGDAASGNQSSKERFALRISLVILGVLVVLFLIVIIAIRYVTHRRRHQHYRELLTQDKSEDDSIEFDDSESVFLL